VGQVEFEVDRLGQPRRILEQLREGLLRGRHVARLERIGERFEVFAVRIGASDG
jgi:hypothetical protein